MQTEKPWVLIVQDDEALALSWAKFFEADGWNAHVTDLGEDAVDLASEYAYDLIYVDAGLPDISGIATIRLMRAAGVEETIVSMNSVWFSEWAIASYKAGADALLMFMCGREEILAQARALLRRPSSQAVSTSPVVAPKGDAWRPSASLYRAWDAS